MSAQDYIDFLHEGWKKREAELIAKVMDLEKALASMKKMFPNWAFEKETLERQRDAYREVAMRNEANFRQIARFSYDKPIDKFVDAEAAAIMEKKK